MLTEGGNCSLHAGDIAAVIGAPDIDHPIESSLILFAVVGDVRGEVGICPVGFFEHAIFVVAIHCRPKPERARFFVSQLFFFEKRYCSINIPRFNNILFL